MKQKNNAIENEIGQMYQAMKEPNDSEDEWLENR